MGLIEGFNIFRKGVENWFSVALFQFILKKDCVCKIKNMGSVNLKGGKNYLNNSLFRALVFCNSLDLSKDQYDILKTYLPQLENDVITVINYEDKNEFKFLNKEIGLIFESFLFGDYRDISYSREGGSLIDIGANVADTAIYFANKGYEVVAFEPLPHICDIAQKNIDLNPQLKNHITFVNKACSCKNGFITINFNEKNTAGASEFSKADSQVKVETITIDKALKQYDIKPNILKMDCEGCEVNIIKHSDLSMFNQIIMEFHTSVTGVDVKMLINILKEQGFKVKDQVKYKDKNLGIVHLVK